MAETLKMFANITEKNATRVAISSGQIRRGPKVPNLS